MKLRSFCWRKRRNFLRSLSLKYIFTIVELFPVRVWMPLREKKPGKVETKLISYPICWWFYKRDYIFRSWTHSSIFDLTRTNFEYHRWKHRLDRNENIPKSSTMILEPRRRKSSTVTFSVPDETFHSGLYSHRTSSFAESDLDYG